MSSQPASPTYHHPPAKVAVGGWRRLISVRSAENVFSVAVMLYAFYFALSILGRGSNVAEFIAWLIVCWAILAYLALPRLNQIITTIYVPDYFVGRTRASDGVLGDPVNLAVRGTAEQIHTAMQRAGWTLADPVTLRSSWKIVVSAVARRSYPTAPVSPLFLFGRMQDFTYQQEVDGNASQRHHVRFFRCPPDWILPGGHVVDWLASGTYDRAVGLSLFTLQVTHKIDENIDIERDYIVDTVCHAVPEARVEVIKDFSTGYHSRNGGGDRVITDGSLPVLQLEQVPISGAAAPPKPSRTGVDTRPVSVISAVVLTLLSTLWSSGQGIHELATEDPVAYLEISDVELAHAFRFWALALVILVSLTLLVLAYRTYQGRAWARVATVAFAAFALANHAAIGPSSTDTLLEVAIDLGIMYSLTTASARNWTGVPQRSSPN